MKVHTNVFGIVRDIIETAEQTAEEFIRAHPALESDEQDYIRLRAVEAAVAGMADALTKGRRDAKANRGEPHA